MSGSRRYRQDRARSRWERADCCGATVAADPARMGARWADVHEAGCGVPWQLTGLAGPPREVYPGAPYLPAGLRLRAVNRRAGTQPQPGFGAAGRHQEGQLRDEPCGCQLIWCRGRWHPRVTCRQHCSAGQEQWEES